MVSRRIFCLTSLLKERPIILLLDMVSNNVTVPMLFGNLRISFLNIFCHNALRIALVSTVCITGTSTLTS